MNILFAIQGTGNGHVSRARDFIPELKKYANIDILLSGTQVDVELGHDVKYRKNGLSFVFGKSGGVDYGKTIKTLHPQKFFSDLWNIDLKSYDFILNDFEPVTAWAGKLKNKKVIALSHQSAFLSKKTPRYMEKNKTAEFLYKNYAPCDKFYAFHFEQYDENIYTPIIRREIRTISPTKNGHYTVYLPAYDDKYLLQFLHQIDFVHWHVFSKHEKNGYSIGNVDVLPIDNQKYNQSVASSSGLLTGGGFEAPAEAMFLGKKVLAIPMKGQYEQFCNAAAMEQMGVPVVYNIDQNFIYILRDWVQNHEAVKVDFPDNAAMITEKIFKEL